MHTDTAPPGRTSSIAADTAASVLSTRVVTLWSPVGSQPRLNRMAAGGSST